MGIHVIKMPDIGEGIAEVELVEWHVQPGDAVVEDQVLADVMTDKATVEIPSPVHGKVVALGGRLGETMAVGSELIRIEGEGTGNVAAEVTADSAKAPAEATVPTEPSAVEPESAAPSPAKSSAAYSSAPAAPAPERPIASPAVRARAWELGIALEQVAGTGPAGRITREDLEAHAVRGAGNRQAAPGAYAERHDETAVPVIGLRRKIAHKMQEAKRHIPHFSYVEEIDVTELEALRARLNERFGGARGRLTVLPLLARAI